MEPVLASEDGDGPPVDLERILDALQGQLPPEEVEAIVDLTIAHPSWARAWAEARAMVQIQDSEDPTPAYSETPTPAELAVLHILWDHGACTVREVLDAQSAAGQSALLAQDVPGSLKQVLVHTSPGFWASHSESSAHSSPLIPQVPESWR